MLETLNGLACAAMACVLGYAILHPRVHDGIVIKAGLILMVLGFLALAMRLLAGLQHDESIGLSRSILLVNSGAFVVLAGYCVRRARAGEPRRRASDFIPFDGETQQ